MGLGPDEMVAILQTTFSNVFFWIKTIYFDSIFT